jgi:NADH-quinone oxidoreductase subunit I
MKLPENSRTFPFLVHDGAPENMRCTACKICEVECPPQCIYIVMERDANGKPLQRPKVFDIDLSVCMQCGICVEVCPFDSIKMDCDYEKSRLGRFEDLLAHLPELLKSNEYYHQIKSAEATRVDATRRQTKKPVTGTKPEQK